ncbi:MAG: hypothetical protein IPK13_03715 [Deltaproteobacteria bacterium]|nr:hypothetical protein [Deltaproteobacteria bacterium]
MTWEQIKKLTEDLKYREALAAANDRLEFAKSENAEADWLRALVTNTQLQIGLGGFETAIAELRAQPWPQSPLYRSTALLFYAQSLSAYLDAYFWEIQTRERVDHTAARVGAGAGAGLDTQDGAADVRDDLKTWTVDDVVGEIQRADEENWKLRGALGAHTETEVADYVERGEYPSGIRSTLRDVVTYQRVEHLDNEVGWRAEHKNATERLDFRKLGRPLEQTDPSEPTDAAEPIDLVDPGVHPLVKIAAVLGDLEAWHRREGNRGAALEAFLERLQRLDAHTAQADVKEQLRQALRERLKTDQDEPWWSMGMARLAAFEREAGMLVRARDTATQGLRAHPDSAGGYLCREIVEALTGPDFSIRSMAQDGLNQRSLRISHRNVDRIWFRAFRIDFDDHLKATRAFRDHLTYEDAAQLLARKPSVAWEVSLPRTPDLDTHQTYVTPPLTERGLYAIVASAQPEFSDKNNRVMATQLVVTDLAVLAIVVPKKGTEVTVVDARTGQPIRGASVSLYEPSYDRRPKRLSKRKTDDNGRVFYSRRDMPSGDSFVFVRTKTDATLSTSLGGYYESPSGRTTECLIYTDRSIYRPIQKIAWKIVAYSSDASRTEHETESGADLTVRLVDANGDEVEQVRVKTNTFGSASGTFLIPSGRLLGSWSIQTSLGGYRSVQVEEYKRPTFEATLGDAEGALRLNQSARIKGTARYYFGLPVTSGHVKWHVTREANYPWWMRWWHPSSSAAERVATGTSKLDDDGAFVVNFLPEIARPKTDADRGTTYTYRVVADVTNDAGETRTATKVVRLGWNAVMATLSPSSNVFTRHAPATITVVRTDLNGAPRPGEATWRVFALKNPGSTRMPSETPVHETSGDSILQPPARTRPEGQPLVETPGDNLQPRWYGEYVPERALAGFERGPEAAHGKLTHAEEGEATVELPKLAPGAYRIVYETKDEHGETYTTHREFVFAGDSSTPLNIPAFLAVAESSARVGESVHVLAHSGFRGQRMSFEIFRAGERVFQRALTGEETPSLITLPITMDDRGGFSLTLTMMRDHQLIRLEQSIFVPWEDKALGIEFSTFRDKIRPGTRETWRVKVTPPRRLANDRHDDASIRAAELLAYMYDASLDVFAPHSAPSILDLYPSRTGAPYLRQAFGVSTTMHLLEGDYARSWPRVTLTGHRLTALDMSTGLGFSGSGFGGGGLVRMAGPGGRARAPMQDGITLRTEDELSVVADKSTTPKRDKKQSFESDGDEPPRSKAPDGASPGPVLRTNFAETAFWMPHLLTDDDGSAIIEFEVPDSVTSWNVFVHAVTRDLRGGSAAKTTRTAKELMVRPYLPRFLRENDQAALSVAVDNTSERTLSGSVEIDIVDLETNQSVLQDFGLSVGGDARRTFSAAAGKGSTIEFPLKAPRRPGLYAFRVIARSDDMTDGEVRTVPVLPSRMHLQQSRFTTLKDVSRRTLAFDDMTKRDDGTRVDERLVVRIDAQLFYSTLDALPYLIEYPYECVEQTLNRFVSTGIMTSLFDRYPAVQHMAKQLSERGTQLESWANDDPNRKLAFEETPWLSPSRGGKADSEAMINVLNPAVATESRKQALERLAKMQRPDGSFPWFAGGPSSSYMTLYLLHGFARATQYKVEVPKDMVQRAWSYLAADYQRRQKAELKDAECCLEYLTFLNYVASSFPDESWGSSALPLEARKQILARSFEHWQGLSPYVKTYLALTLHRMNRGDDARLVFDSVMDASRTTEDEGTFWAPEDRSWLWYNDTIETHAFALMALLELRPDDVRRHGLVQWLLMNKKLNHWKSTRATAEVIYALVRYLEHEGTLAVREEIDVQVGPTKKQFVFLPDKYTGKNNQIVVPGTEIDPKTMSKIEVSKSTPGFAFASATWHFSTDELPKEGSGDFFSVSRKYFKRVRGEREALLVPLTEGERLEVGDEVEVQLSIRAKHAAEYVHLRDPRAAGFEPEIQNSGYSWASGMAWYEEIRDSGANFFFEALPVGEYTFRYRLRATMAGAFRVGPATLQSMYAPEFAAYSAGHLLTIVGRLSQ